MTKTPISTGKVLDFKDFRKYSDTFVESGTAMGGGVERAIGSGFANIRSVEAKDTYYIHCVKKFIGLDISPEDICKGKVYTNIKEGGAIDLYFGMSQDVMKSMLTTITKPAVIWSDAHVSGPNSAGHEDYMEKGNDSAYAQDNVITAELKIILAHRKDHIILIDDQNGFTDEVKKYMAMILEANPNYEFFMYDEQRGDERYIDKCLVCIPN
jgi:hypothetical protein